MALGKKKKQGSHPCNGGTYSHNYVLLNHRCVQCPASPSVQQRHYNFEIMLGKWY